ADTRVEVVFDVAASPSLGPRQRDRLLAKLGPEVRVVVADERSQVRNRAIALDRLRDRLAAGLAVERTRTATKPTRASKERRLEVHLGGLLEPDALDRCFVGGVDAVVHFAGCKAVGESVALPLKYYENNVAATVELLKAMQRHDVRDLVFSSSCTVYGEPETVPVTERSPISAASPSGR